MVEVNNNSSVPRFEFEVDPETGTIVPPIPAEDTSPTSPREEVNLEKNAELLDMDVEGAYRSLVNESGLNSFEALRAIKKKVLSSMREDPRFNLDREASDRINETLSPNEVLLKYTNIRDRGAIEAFLEGAASSAVITTPGLYGAIKAGFGVGRKIAALPIPHPVFKGAAVGIGGTVAAVATLTGVTAVMQSVWDKAVKGTPFQNDPFLPEDYGLREGGKTVGTILGGSVVARPFLKNIPKEGSDFFVKKATERGVETVAKAINPMKENWRRRAMETMSRGGKRINPFQGNFWKTLTKNIGESARNTTKNRIGLTPYTTAEVTASVGSGTAAVAAEKAFPGELVPRMMAETAGAFVGSLFPIGKAALELGKDTFSALEFLIPEKIFGQSTGQAVQRAKDRRIGKTFLKRMKEAFDEEGKTFDEEKFISSINKQFTPEEIAVYGNDPAARTIGFITNNDALKALQARFAQQSPEFAEILTQEIRDETAIITGAVRALMESGNPDAIRVATDFFSTSFGNNVEAALNISVNKIDPLIDSIRGGAKGFDSRAQASAALRASILDVYEGANNIVDGLWSRVDLSVEASPRNALAAITRAFDRTRGGGNKARFVYEEGKKIGQWDPGRFSSSFTVPILKRIEQAGARVKYKDWADLTPAEKIKFKNEPNVNKGQGGPRRVKVDSGYNSMILNEMKNDRAVLMAEAKNLPEGATVERALMLSLAEGLMEDMMGAVVVNKSNKANFEKARAASLVVRDIFDRTFAKTVINKDEPMLLRLNSALGLGKDKGRVVFEEVEDAAEILSTLGGEFGRKATGKTTIDGVETTLESVGAAANASVEWVSAGLLGTIIANKNIFKTVNVDVPTLPGQPKRTMPVEVVDERALKKLLEDPMVERILGFEAFKFLKTDLESANTLTLELLIKALPELKRQADKTEGNIRLLSNILYTDNPAAAINRVLDSGEPLVQFKALSKMVAEAQDAEPGADVKNAFMATLVDTLVMRAATSPDTADINSFRRMLEEPILELSAVKKGTPVGGITQDDSIKTILKEYNLVEEDFFKRLGTLYKGFEYLTRYASQVIDPASKETDDALKLVASLIGASAAPKTRTGSIAIPAAAAKYARSVLSDTPQLLLYVRMKELLSPGHSKEFVRALRLGQEATSGVDTGEVIARQLANYLKAGAIASSSGAARGIAEDIRESDPPTIIKSAEARPARPPITNVTIPERPPITPLIRPEAPDVSGEFNPETYKRLFPYDGLGIGGL